MRVHPTAGAGRFAFTLVELLVVIGIISLLISILLPSLARARQAANSLACLSNLRQLGVVLFMYAEDNRQTLPPGHMKDSWRNWAETVSQYMTGWDGGPHPGIFRCPEATIPSGDFHFGAHFQIFANLNDPRARMGKLSEFRSRSTEMVLLADQTQNPQTGNASTMLWWVDPMWQFYNESTWDNALPFRPPLEDCIDAEGHDQIRWRHPGMRANFLFADGHAASHPYGELQKRHFRCERNGRKLSWELGTASTGL